MKRIFLFSILLLLSTHSFAQQEPDADEYGSGTPGIQFGGWISPMILFQQEGNGSQLGSFVNATKLFIAYQSDYFSTYIRGKNTTMVKMYARDFTGDTVNSFTDLDIAFLKVNSKKKSLNFTLGRKYYYIGSGFVLNGRGDGAQFDLFSKIADLSVFGMYTGFMRKEANPYRLNAKDYADGSERLFAGGEISRNIYNQTIYAFGLMQKDMRKDISDYETYNSQYYAFGVKGIIRDNVKYHTEGIYETGKSYDFAQSKSTDIKAYAALAMVDYYIKSSIYPVLNFQYTYASGDSDRANYITSSNQSGNDSGFMQFGTFMGGYALRPVPGNMHIIRSGFTLAPFTDGNTVMKRSSYSLKYTLYLKDKTDSAINDGSQSGGDARLAGHGIDFAMRWKIYSDLYGFATYAVYIPGSAYSSNEKIHQFSLVGMTLSF